MQSKIMNLIVPKNIGESLGLGELSPAPKDRDKFLSWPLSPVPPAFGGPERLAFVNEASLFAVSAGKLRPGDDLGESFLDSLRRGLLEAQVLSPVVKR